MPHILTHCWQALSMPPWRARFVPLTAGGASEGAAHTGGARPNDAATRAERLECIALYAQAGYFNMGPSLDVFWLCAETPLS